MPCGHRTITKDITNVILSAHADLDADSYT